MTAQEHVPGIVRMVVRETAAGQNMVNVFHVGRVGLAATAWTQTDLDAATAFMYSQYQSSFLPIQTTNITLAACEGTDLTSVIGKQSIHTESHVGTGGTSPQSLSVAMCISWKQAVRYRGGHPRTYLAGLDNGARADARHWTAGAVADVQGRAQNFRQNLEINGFQLVYVKRIVNHANLTPPVAVPIVTASVDLRVDSQRRRLGRL